MVSWTGCSICGQDVHRLVPDRAGNFSNVEGVGAGVFEYKIDFGPGYRMYFGKEGEDVVILVGGGTKKRQTQAIKLAQERWQDYKRRKRQSEVR